MDKLKQYLEQHRAEMDVDLPPENTWQGIQAEGSSQKTVKRFSVVMRYAAAVLLIIMSGALWLLTNKKQVQPVGLIVKKEKPAQNRPEPVLPKKDGKKPSIAIQPVAFVSTAKTSLKKTRPNQAKPMSADVASVDKGYAKLVAYQIKRLRTTPVYVESPDYFTGFARQLAQMDKDEQGIKSDMKRYGMDDQLLESLINIYQQKLNLLQTLQNEIRQMNNTVEEKLNRQEPRPYYLNL